MHGDFVLGKNMAVQEATTLYLLKVPGSGKGKGFHEGMDLLHLLHLKFQKGQKGPWIIGGHWVM